MPVVLCTHYFDQVPARQARTGKWPVLRFSKDKVMTEIIMACADLKTVLSAPFRVLILMLCCLLNLPNNLSRTVLKQTMTIVYSMGIDCLSFVPLFVLFVHSIQVY